MAVYAQSSISKEFLKVRWQEPYVSAALNNKFFGIFPKGVYAGFVITALGTRTINVGPGFLADSYGSGLTSPGYVSGNYDESVGWSLAVHQSPAGYSTTVAIPPGTYENTVLSCTGLDGQRAYVAIDVNYSTSTETDAQIKLVSAAELQSDPSMICCGYVDVPANPATPISSGDIGYSDSSYPRVNPLSTPQRSGLMPPAAWALIYDRFNGTAGSTENRIPVSVGTTGKVLQATSIEASGQQIGNLTGVVIGDTIANLDSSAALKVKTTTKGFLPPVLTTTQRDAISSPSTGLTIYNSSLKRVDSYTGLAWSGQTGGFTYADLIVGSTAQVNAGAATHTSITSALAAASAGQKILVLAGTYTENITVSLKVMIEGVGHSSNLNGTMTFDSNSDYSSVKNMRISGNITFNSGADGIFLRDCWQGSSSILTNSGSGNSILMIRE